MASIAPASLKQQLTLHNSPTSIVYTATLAPDGATVVVKRTKITCSNDIARFNKEIELLSVCRHERVIQPLGVIREAPTYAIVLPPYSRGALFGLLHNSAHQLTPAAAVQLSADVASAVAHVHQISILHRDIKSDNILVTDDGRAVLTDFNAAELSARITSDIVVQARPTGGFFKQFVVGTLPYMAPELLRSVRGAAFTPSCDVYSLGILLNEIGTQTIPYSDALTEQVKLQTILEARYNCDSLTAAITAQQLRPKQPSETTGALAALAQLACQCWADAASERPEAAQVQSSLDLLVCDAGLLPKGADELFLPALATNCVDAPPPVQAIAGSAPGQRQSHRGVGSFESAASAVRRMAEMTAAAGLEESRAAVEETAGARGKDRMEDRYVLQQSGGLTLAAVFDGHNGDTAADFCAASLPAELLRAWSPSAEPTDDSSMAAALCTAFVSLNDRFLSEFPLDESGTTAIAVLCTPTRIVVANAGDCSCMLWRGEELESLSHEHTAELAEERARVLAAGGSLSTTADGKVRVGGVIQVTRCIGDRKLRAFGLSAEPELRAVERIPADRALIVACDGLWDVMPRARVLHCLNNTAQSPDMIAKRLLFEAVDRGSTDNITVIVVLF